ncbi:MAG: tol-pal system-associated acyl-CoA thioesterase [Alphaproteobacteria bacterium]|nr:tol-pal system-associated acyl-CoA thioesterase [Alphaproteobacteria bacterium]
MHTFTLRVYYEDTDAGGVVFYANYLKFTERARTEFLRNLGIESSAIARDHGVFIVVRHVEADYKAAARLDDLLTVDSRVVDLGKASFTMQQDISRAGALLVSTKVALACMGTDGKAARMPQILREKLEGL